MGKASTKLNKQSFKDDKPVCKSFASSNKLESTITVLSTITVKFYITVLSTITVKFYINNNCKVLHRQINLNQQ